MGIEQELEFFQREVSDLIEKQIPFSFLLLELTPFTEYCKRLDETNVRLFVENLYMELASAFAQRTLYYWDHASSFLFVAPHLDSQKGARLTEDALKRIWAAKNTESPVLLTFCGGIIGYPQEENNSEQLFPKVQQLSLLSRNAGTNHISSFSELGESLPQAEIDSSGSSIPPSPDLTEKSEEAIVEVKTSKGFIGRRKELAYVQSILGQEMYNTSMFLVAGDNGIGKSFFLSEVHWVDQSSLYVFDCLLEKQMTSGFICASSNLKDPTSPLYNFIRRPELRKHFQGTMLSPFTPEEIGLLISKSLPWQATPYGI